MRTSRLDLHVIKASIARCSPPSTSGPPPHMTMKCTMYSQNKTQSPCCSIDMCCDIYSGAGLTFFPGVASVVREFNFNDHIMEVYNLINFFRQQVLVVCITRIQLQRPWLFSQSHQQQNKQQHYPHHQSQLLNHQLLDYHVFQ